MYVWKKTTILAQTTEEKRGPIMAPSKKKGMSSGGMRKPVIVIKSVDVTDSPAKETGETSKMKEEEEEVRKEMSVEVAPASVYDEVVEMQKISSEESSDSAASSLNYKMASSSFDLATFVKVTILDHASLLYHVVPSAPLDW